MILGRQFDRCRRGCYVRKGDSLIGAGEGVMLEGETV